MDVIFQMYGEELGAMLSSEDHLRR